MVMMFVILYKDKFNDIRKFNLSLPMISNLIHLLMIIFMQFFPHVVKGEVQSRITIISKERVKISLQIGSKIMKIG